MDNLYSYEIDFICNCNKIKRNVHEHETHNCEILLIQKNKTQHF